MSITTHNVDVIIPFGGLKTVMGWCENNCQQDWILAAIADKQDEYEFVFESEEDAVLFALRWR